MRKSVIAKAEMYAEERVLDALVGQNAGDVTRASFREKLRKGEGWTTAEIELEVQDKRRCHVKFWISQACRAQSMSMLNIGDLLGKAMGYCTQTPQDDRLPFL